MHTNKSPRNVWLFSCLGCGGLAFVLLVFAVGCGALVSSSPAPPDGPSTAEEAADAGSDDGEPAAIGFGEAGTVGDWTVTVDGIETAATYGDEFLEETAQGEFKVVALTVKNGGSEATYFDSTAVKLVDGEGAEYSSQTVIGSDVLFIEQINPGNNVSGEAVVDVPAGTEIVSVVVEDVWSFTSEPLVIDVS